MVVNFFTVEMQLQNLLLCRSSELARNWGAPRRGRDDLFELASKRNCANFGNSRFSRHFPLCCPFISTKSAQRGCLSKYVEKKITSEKWNNFPLEKFHVSEESLAPRALDRRNTVRHAIKGNQEGLKSFIPRKEERVQPFVLLSTLLPQYFPVG